MTRGHEKTFIGQVGCKRGTLRETSTVSSLVTIMSVEELRLFSHVPVNIKLEVADNPATPTIGGADNVVYFTHEQFVVGLRFPIQSLVKQFLHFTRALPTLVQLNVFHILMDCSVLNLIYLLDISLVEICFIYTLKLGVEGRLSMSAHNPRLQFVTGLLNSPKTEAKGVVLVEGLWYETLGSLGLPFDLNRSLTFLGLFQLDGACTSLGRLYFDMPLFSEPFVGRSRRGRLVSWVEKARLDRIRWLLEITERELNHELLLSTKNLYELGASPFPYIVLVIPRPLLEELIKGEHFILAGLLKSIPGSSSQAGSDQTEFAQEALTTFVQLNQSPLAV